MELGPIERKHYGDFIMSWLSKGGYKIDPQNLEHLFDIGQDVPHNIQRLCHNMWEAARESLDIPPSLIEQLPFDIARQDSPHYELLWQSASQAQKILLAALAKDPDVKTYSKEFQLKHRIGSSSSTKASLDSLTKKGIFYRTIKGRYRFSDAFMPYWINNL